MLVLIFGMFMSLPDATIVNVAVTAIEGDLGASSDEVQSVVTAYAPVWVEPLGRNAT